MTKDILETPEFFFFWKGWPNQWTMRDFVLDGVQYNCCEQYMMSRKAIFSGDTKINEQIMAETRPWMHKKLGRQVSNFDQAQWDIVKLHVVASGNMARFSQHPQDKEKLLATEEKMIVEASPFDKVWGIGMGVNHPDILIPEKWQGENLLGKALMNVRTALKTGQPMEWMFK